MGHRRHGFHEHKSTLFVGVSILSPFMQSRPALYSLAVRGLGVRATPYAFLEVSPENRNDPSATECR